MTDIRARAIAIYDAFTHEHLDRRRMLRDMIALAGSAAAAEALIAGIAASPAAAQRVAPDDRAIVASRIELPVARFPALHGYRVVPATPGGKRGAVIVIHENRGLNGHIEDVARRLALAGFLVLAPDLLSPWGGTPADEDRARDMIARADSATVMTMLLAAMTAVRGWSGGDGRVGAIGFCWGGATVNRLAVAAGERLDAGVVYYGPAPDPAEAGRVRAPLLLHFAGQDARVNATGAPWVAALRAAGRSVEAHDYPGVDHAFNNDTAADRYNAAAADLAWARSIAFLHRHLDPRA